MESKVVAVTGGSRGIGAAIVVELASRGWDIAFTHLRDGDRARAVAALVRERGRRCVAFESEVSKPESAEELATAAREVGPVRGWVANAGICAGKLMDDITPADLEEHMNVNFMGTFYGMQVAAREMVNGGSIVAISSISALMGGKLQAHYCASKAAQSGAVRAAALCYGKQGIRVNAVAPGSISPTGLNGACHADAETLAKLCAPIPLGRLGTPGDVAKCVAFLLSDDASYVTGSTLTVDGGWSVNLQ